MADIVVTAADVSVVHPDRALRISGRAGVTITKGQAIYQGTAGTWLLADGSAAASVNGVCLALDGVAAGETLSILVEGFVYGFTVASIQENTAINVSNTAGALDAGGSPDNTGTVGRIWAIDDGSSTLVQLLYFRSNLNTVIS